MGWIECISEAINYIEENITQTLSIDEIAKQAAISPFYFQKGFSMLCGMTVGEYIRLRRLTLAGSELVSSDSKIIDVAYKYGYESPDSFTKAFTRFHGTTPSAVKKDGAMIRSFAPLKIKFTLEGGSIMDYKIVKKAAFTVIGVTKTFDYETAATEVPKFWQDYCMSGKDGIVCGEYGISIDETMGNDKFDYIIGCGYDPTKDIPDGYTTTVIPEHTWAVFICKGAMPKSIQDVQGKIFSEWLPNCSDYTIAAGYNIEMYADPADYENGTQDNNYYSEVWIPVKKK